MKKYSNVIVLLVILLNTCFAGAVLYCFVKTCVEPTALIASWFAFTTGELWMLKDIKKTKIKEGSDKHGKDYDEGEQSSER